MIERVWIGSKQIFVDLLSDTGRVREGRTQHGGLSCKCLYIPGKFTLFRLINPMEQVFQTETTFILAMEHEPGRRRWSCALLQLCPEALAQKPLLCDG